MIYRAVTRENGDLRILDQFEGEDALEATLLAQARYGRHVGVLPMRAVREWYYWRDAARNDLFQRRAGI